MALKTTVKVGSISNLSDARYCAGMGVDLLGFRVSVNDPYYVNPTTFQEFRGWFSGPAVVAEIHGLTTADELEKVINDYAPDYLEVTLQELNLGLQSEKSLILSVTFEEFEQNKSQITQVANQIKYVIVPKETDADQIRSITFPVLYLANAEALDMGLIESLGKTGGIALNGTPEEKPGLKSYDGIADVLEMLEVEN